MGELTVGVNWLAVFVGAVAAFMLGGLWYSPKLFGTKWAEGVRVSMDDGQSKSALITQAIATFLLAWIVGITAAADALMTVLLIVLTIACLMAAGGLFSRKSGYAIATEAGFVVVMAVIMIAVHAVL